MLYRAGGRWWTMAALHRTCFQIAVKFFNDGPGYVEGNARLLTRIARGFEFYSSALALPEYHGPLTMEQYLEIVKARNSG